MHPDSSLLMRRCSAFLLAFLFSLVLSGLASASAPVVTTLSPSAGSTLNTTAGFTALTVTFDQPVVNVIAENLLINSNPAQSVTISPIITNGTVWIFSFTQPAPGTVTVSWDPDNAIEAQSGGTPFGDGLTYSYTLADTTAPTVALQTPPPGTTVNRLTQTEVTFSEAVQGVTASSLLVNGVAATSVAGTDVGPYVFSFPQPPNGTVTFQWAPSQTITDFAATPNAFAGGSWTVTMNTAQAVGNIVINEFLTRNVSPSTFVDEDGSLSQWIELYNKGATSVNLAGWSLSDDASNSDLWVFPSGSQSVIPAGGYMVIWADGKDRKNPTSPAKMHTNFTITQAGEYLGLFSAELPRAAVSQYSPTYPQQRANISYGFDSSNALKYFNTPTPGTANGTSTISGTTSDINFSVNHGYFSGPFNLVLSTPTSGATIQYTTDGSVPTLANGTTYSAPITISATTVIRAAAFGTNMLPSNVSTQTYIFVSSVLTQPSNPPGYPIQFTGYPLNNTWIDTGSYSPANVLNGSQCYYQMDQGIVASDSAFIKAGLLELPSVCINMPIADFFSQNTGIYTHPLEKGSQWERACSVEMIYPNGSVDDFQVNAGVQIQGGSSRDPVKNFKHSFRILFKGTYGDGTLNKAVLPGTTVANFNDLDVDGGSNDTWDYVGGSSQVDQRTRAQQTHDAFASDLLNAMGWPSFHSKFINLYLNGLYFGVLYLHERPDQSFCANYFGGDKSEYDVLRITTTSLEVEGANGFITTSSLSTSSPDYTYYLQWKNMFNFLSSKADNLSDNADYATMQQYVDVDAFADYMIANLYTNNTDWPSHNFYAGRHRVNGGKFYFSMWDAEHVLESKLSMAELDNYPSGTPGEIWRALKTNAEFKLLFADHVQKHFFNGGVLYVNPSATIYNPSSPQNNIPASYYVVRTNEINNAIAAESAKWGAYTQFYGNNGSNPSPGFQTPGTYTRTTWMQTLNDLLGTNVLGGPTPSTGDASYNFLSTQSAFAVTRFQQVSEGLFPANSASAPLLNQFGGRVPAGFQLTLSLPTGTNATNGTIYYTTDGSDPRLFGSGLPATAANGGTALAYTGPITMNAGATLKARILNTGSVWSALTRADFTVGAPVVPVKITELMYKPSGGSQYEFVEIQNVGTVDVNIGSYSFDGIEYLFPPNTIISAGQRMVVGSNSNIAQWQARYPSVVPIGYFNGSLDNSGERIALLDSKGRVIDAVNYLPNSGWPTAPSTNGNSLERTDPFGNSDDPTNWHASAASNGTPGLANSTPSGGNFELSEIMASNVSAVNNGGTFPPWIEVHNTTGSSASIAGWSVSNDGTPRKYTFPAGTTIPANGYLVIWCDSAASAPGLHTGFGLSATGDKVQLYDASSTPVWKDGVLFGNQVADYTIGKITGIWQLNNPTPSAANSPASVAASTDVVINEWMANPLPPNSSWIELYNKNASLPAALRGDYLQTSTDLFPITALTFIPPHGYLQLFTDEQVGVNHVDFFLPASGTSLSLLDSGGNTASTVTFGAQTQNVSQGRSTDGGGSIVSFPNGGTPASGNFVNSYTGPAINEVLAFNSNGLQAPWGTRAGWVELFNSSGSSFDLSGYRLGAVNNAGTAWAFPTGSVLAANNYLLVWFDASQPASTSFGTDMNAGVALNGVSGGVYLYNSAGQLMNLIEYGFQITDKSIGFSSGHWNLMASATPRAANSSAATLGSVSNLRVNEWLAAESTGNDWFELYNLDANPVNMAGLYLTDDPSTAGQTQFQVGALSFINGNGWVRWEADSAVQLGRNHVNFNLSASGEYILISNNDANLTPIDAVSFGPQNTDVSQGRIPDGAANIVSMPGSPTPGARNVLLPAPMVTTQPTNQSVNVGSSATFLADGTGSNPLTFQWQLNGVNIAGATSKTLSINPANVASDGIYTCVLTNTAGTAVSNPAKLTVNASFSQWESYYFTAGELGDPSVSGANADPDKDGISNLQEFFHHINPRQAATAADRAALPQVGYESGSTTYVTLTFRQAAGAVFTGVALQASTALEIGWSTVTPDVIQNLGNDPVTGDPIVKWKVIVQPGQGKKFLRLQITQ